MITHNKNNDYTGFLGNVMFQVASTIGIAVKNNMECSFNSSSQYLSNFKNVPLKTLDELNQFNFVDVPEQSFGFVNVNLIPERHYQISGYRQTEKYFSHCKELIKTTFEFKDDILNACKTIIEDLKRIYVDKKIISVHIRCGDYLTLKNHHTCLMDIGYYQKALEQFIFDESIFVVFSDDINIASEFFKNIHPGKITYIMGPKMSPANDMCLMSLMDGHVIANSSFSWWASWLSGKKTVSPSKNKWFGIEYKNMEVKDIIPESWTQIE